MKPEEALALLLCRSSFDKLTQVRIFHLIKNGIDWYEFLNICVRKKLICLVYQKLVDLKLTQLLPLIIVNNMQSHYEQNQKQNERFLQAAAPIISYINENDIIAVPVKGLRFLNTIYSKNPAVRILSDIDFIASSNAQAKIHNFMTSSGYDMYLVNDEDVFCFSGSHLKSCFYINFEKDHLYGRLRVDFDFGCPDLWIKLIHEEKHPVYEFLYLCYSYYEETYNRIQLKNIASYNYIKLIDLHEYYIQYLSNLSLEDILIYADRMNIRRQLEFTAKCLKNIYPEIFQNQQV